MALSVKAIREEIASYKDRVAAIVAVAESEARDLSVEEKTEIDGINGVGEKSGKIQALVTDLERAEKYEKIQKDLAASRVKDQFDASGHVARPEATIRVPARARTPVKNFKTAEDAYASGMFLSAISGNKRARMWCKEHGIMNAMTSADNTKGGFTVPDMLEASLIELRQQYGVFRQNARVVPMSEAVSNWPKLTGSTTVYFIGEDQTSAGTGTGVTASDMAFEQVRLVAKTAGVYSILSNDLNEDSAISMAELFVRDAAMQFAAKEDDCGFNGDGTSTYGGIQGAKNALLAGSKYTAATGQTAFSTLTLATFEAMIGQLKYYAGIQPLWYISPAGFAASMLRLVDAGGGNTNATLSNGIGGASFLGYPVVLSNVLNTTLTAQVSTTGLCYFGDLAMAAYLGDRKGITVAADSSVHFKQNSLALRGIQRFDINVHDIGTASASGALIALVTPGA